MFDFIESHIIDIDLLSATIRTRKRYELFMLFFKPIFILFIIVNARWWVSILFVFELIYLKLSILYSKRKSYNKIVNAVGGKFTSYNDIIANKSSNIYATNIVYNHLKRLPFNVIQEFCSYGGKVEIVDECTSRHGNKDVVVAGVFSYKDDGTPYISIGDNNYLAIEHKFGHFIDAISKYKSYSIKFLLAFWIERFKYYFTRYISIYDLYMYNHYQNPGEWFAEAFSVICENGLEVDDEEIPRTKKVVMEAIDNLNSKWDMEV